MAGDYDVYDDIWPGAIKGEAAAPVGVGIDASTGRIIAGWPHTQQSIYRLFKTRYHSRVMRYYVGSFVPHLIGQNATMTPITRFWWAMATAIELWEPRYAVQRIGVSPRREQGRLGETNQVAYNTPEGIRQGLIAFRTIGIEMPRGHLGDKTPAGQRELVVLGEGNNVWRVSGG